MLVLRMLVTFLFIGDLGLLINKYQSKPVEIVRERLRPRLFEKTLALYCFEVF